MADSVAMSRDLRSLDYAARVAERTSSLEADRWLGEARSAFIGAYGAIGPSESALMEALELEKACYEIRYEASNPPRLALAAARRSRTTDGHGLIVGQTLTPEARGPSRKPLGPVPARVR
ncbi:MAG: hypothetical protein ACRDGD_11340 [Candidatus Limnocylindria bacterium]